MNYWTPAGKQAFLRSKTGLLTSGDFRYCAGLSPASFRALPEGCGHLDARVCRNGLMNYWTPAKKQAFLRTITGLLTSGNFRYYAGLSPARFRALPEGCGHLFGRVCRNGLMNYWTPVKRQAFSRTITGLLTSGNFRYYLGLSPARFRALPDGAGIFRGVSVTMG